MRFLYRITELDNKITDSKLNDISLIESIELNN